jgi:hypothetical protein
MKWTYEDNLLAPANTPQDVAAYQMQIMDMAVCSTLTSVITDLINSSQSSDEKDLFKVLQNKLLTCNRRKPKRKAA